jgi:hypothetical protein
VLIAVAVADSRVALLKAIEDLAGGTIKINAVETIGLERPDAVRLVIC